MSLIIAGERSGVGKTTVTLTLLSSLYRHKKQVQSFKVGPDYIDPMFHQHVTGRACRNLDPVLTSEAYVQQCFSRHSQGVDYALIEGVMGLFDGVKWSGEDKEIAKNIFPLSSFASTAHIARLLDLPVVLVIDCSRLSGSVAAIAYGYCSFDPGIKIAGLVLNRVGSDRHLSLLKDSLEPLQLPIIGVLRRQDNITIPDRHLGLIPTEELPELNAVIERLADLGDTCFDWEKLLPLLRSSKEEGQARTAAAYTSTSPLSHSPIRIGVARDRAFNFYYQDNLDLLQELGAELVFWSPLEDTKLPFGVQGMYFGGGFPEIFAQQLAENTNTRDAIRTAILEGMPTIAECGGLMYLCEEVVDFEGKSWPMVGVLPTTAVMDKRLTLGYRRAVALSNSLLFDAGTTVCGHEFHRSRLILEPSQPLFKTYRYDSEEFTGHEGWSLLENLHASYVHMHWGATAEIPQRFLEKIIAKPFVPTLLNCD
ncbi:MAG: cobyrinate a,c-diamide synthase [Cyanomargarita calcarea GSE-NOS-MK-12-04C]|jgi:cobyrinic acid a,c-diamide synthase|uniref:Cobyrinate a,c-diamide synthase n=1 Tax=Cyanomargarita calcarea GSE-NOS-MK-12-04C TaxID=2839659 RepID=A0A951QS24_9CYAN|nr:cobyrinate a,c-diamide synthase [Cyanomargarita calcarea GSE-NOS-MK-12-04C]